ncbi:MAG: DinB family protein [Gemmatimonadaceae bacterium]|nr:DinB family protein [Gemmatimonadaceae bacterium]
MSNTEWWQRGPVDGVPAMLQPVAHIVLQVGESVHELVAPLTEAQWNARPANVASIAFHVRHIVGVLDRLFTYARGEALSEAQFVALRGEGAPIAQGDIATLLARLDAQVASALAELRAADPSILGDFRGVGRAQLPSTVIGCLVHGAEHSMRHVGQLSVTASVVRL